MQMPDIIIVSLRDDKPVAINLRDCKHSLIFYQYHFVIVGASINLKAYCGNSWHVKPLCY
jgi:hypothetical protein